MLAAQRPNAGINNWFFCIPENILCTSVNNATTAQDGTHVRYVSFSASFISEDHVRELHLEAGTDSSGKKEFPIVAPTKHLQSANNYSTLKIEGRLAKTIRSLDIINTSVIRGRIPFALLSVVAYCAVG